MICDQGSGDLTLTEFTAIPEKQRILLNHFGVADAELKERIKFWRIGRKEERPIEAYILVLHRKELTWACNFIAGVDNKPGGKNYGICHICRENLTPVIIIKKKPAVLASTFNTTQRH